MQERLAKSVLRSHWPQLPGPLPHTPCPLPSEVYPPWTRVPDAAVLWWSPTSRQPGEEAQGSSCSSGETCLHLLHPLQKLRWSFSTSLQPFCSGVCPTPLESLLLWVTSFMLSLRGIISLNIQPKLERLPAPLTPHTNRSSLAQNLRGLRHWTLISNSSFSL